MSKKMRKGFLEVVLLAVVAGIILGTGWAIAKVHHIREAYTPTNLIRLHIIGNSDSQADQEVKLSIRDSLANTFGRELTMAKNARQAERIIKRLLPQIEDKAKECLATAGMGYHARAGLKTVCFPDRYYEDDSGQSFFLPEGAYRSLQIILGEGKGCNWWCVMYPPLCFVDIARANHILRDSAETFAIVIDSDQTAVFDEEQPLETSLELRFLLLDIFQKGKRALSSIFASRLSNPPTSP